MLAFDAQKHSTLFAMFVVAILTIWATPAAAEDGTSGPDDLVKVGAVGGVPELAGVSVAATPAFLQFEFVASLPVLTTDYRNQVFRAGVRPKLLEPTSARDGFELRLPLMVGPRHQYNGDAMQPRCFTAPCPGVQENKWFVSAYCSLEASWSFDNRFDAFVEAGGGYNFQTNAENPSRDLPGIPEARFMIGVGY
jgi:hypothetical protein